MAIINSIVDNDLYKITMQFAIIKTFPNSEVEYTFVNRGKTQFPDGFDYELRKEIDSMRNLALTQEEKKFLQEKCGHYLDRPYLDFLEGYRYEPSEVGVILKDGELNIKIRGFWYRTVLWEVPLMALISELYFKMTNQEPAERGNRQQNNVDKGIAFQVNNMILSEFGTRRRYSYQVQDEVVSDLKSCYGSNTFLKGTSNVHFAMKYGLNPHGTHAHEWVSGIAAIKGYSHANKHMMECWSNVYNGSLGIALTDTFGVNSFLRDFDIKFSKLFDGVRHDSGNPIEFADKIINHYNSLGINPNSKTIIFSDGLDLETCLEIYKHCKGKIGCSFGVGTNLTNDVGVKPLNMVIKLTKINSMNVIKLSESKNKHTGDSETIEIVKKMINYPT
jgi:nicotinate phosphoribosyltransferase